MYVFYGRNCKLYLSTVVFFLKFYKFYFGNHMYYDKYYDCYLIGIYLRFNLLTLENFA